MKFKILTAVLSMSLGLGGYLAWHEHGRLWWRVSGATMTIDGVRQEQPKIYSQGTDQLLIVVPGHHPQLGSVQNPYVVHFPSGGVAVPNWGDTYEAGRLFVAPASEIVGVSLVSGKFDKRYPFSVSTDHIEFVDQLSDEYHKIEIDLAP